MPEPIRKKVHHFNTPGHAHELTFSCYKRSSYLLDQAACEILLEEIGKARQIYLFRLWAYVLMPNHVHMLIWPMNARYDISKILSGIKRVASKRYGGYLKEKDMITYNRLHIDKNQSTVFTFWQPGGGFDRNMWNSKAIHDSINYIEANPVRKKLVNSPEKWPWSSAYARINGKSLLPDKFDMPVLMPNVQAQSIKIG